MTTTVEQSLQQGLNDLNRKVDTLIAALLGDEQFGEGRIPRLERRIDDHETRIGEIEEAREVEQARSGIVLNSWQKAAAFVVALTVFVYHAVGIAQKLKLIP